MPIRVESKQKMDYTVIAVIDTKTATKVAEIKADSGRVEAINFEHSGSRMFANFRTKGRVGVFDKNNYKLSNTWPIPDATENVPMTLNEPDHRGIIRHVVGTSVGGMPKAGTAGCL